MGVSKYLFAAGVLFLALTARANTISVNGTCVAGNCADPDVINVPPGATLQSPFSFTYTLANNDQYSFAGEVTVSLAPGQVMFRENISNLIVTYLGNRSGGVSGDDIIMADFTQQFFIAGRVMPHPENALISGRFRDGMGAGSSVSGQFSSTGNEFPLLGPFGFPPDEFFGSTTALMAGGEGISQNWEYVLQFGSRSSVGSSIALSSAPVPEPSSLAMMVLGGAGILMGLIRCQMER